MKRLLCSLFILVGSLVWSADDTVIASKFGFDEKDATACLQKALDSGAKTVIVDNTGKPWIVRPVDLRSDQEVVLKDGVVIRAKSGEYKSRVACMLNICSVKNVTLRGEGTARLEMPKADYMDESRYEWAEWRHAINIADARNVTVRNLTAKGSGGDGVYIRSHSKDILLEDLVMLDHHRQGISIISVENLTVRHCTFNDTWGTAPMCGLDIEPNVPQDVCKNILFEDCVFDNNRSAGICLHLLPLNDTTQPISVVFRRCVARGNSSGFMLNACNGKPYKGTVLLEDCHFSDNKNGVLRIGAMHRDGITLAFKNCSFDNRGCKASAITFSIGSSNDDMTGVSFEKCTLNPGTAPALYFVGKTGYGVTGVTGDITLPDGKLVDLEGLKAKYRPDPELRKFQVAQLDTKALKPMGGNLPVDAENKVWMRYGCTALQHFPAPGEYPIRFLVNKFNKERNSMTRVTILDTNGNEYGKFNFTETDYTYTFKARSAGVYRFLVSNNFAIALESNTPGFGIDASDRVPLFRGGKHRLYFVVPAGAEEVKVETGGEQGEPITVELLNAKGESVSKAVRQEGATFLVGKRPANAPAEVWSVNMTNVYEDHGIRIGAPCIPVFYTNPNLLFINK